VEGLTVQEQLDRVEGQLYKLACEVEDNKRNAEDNLAKGQANARDELAKAVQDMSSKMERVWLGDTAMELIGVILIAVGIILSACAGGLPFGLARFAWSYALTSS
jgi:hypothetical protein